MYCILCTVYCVLCTTVYCILCTVYYCILCTVDCVLCTVYCILYTVYCRLYTVYCILYTVYCTVYCVLLYTVYCILCTVDCILYTVYCRLCTVYCVLCTVDCMCTRTMLVASEQHCVFLPVNTAAAGRLRGGCAPLKGKVLFERCLTESGCNSSSFSSINNKPNETKCLSRGLGLFMPPHRSYLM